MQCHLADAGQDGPELEVEQILIKRGKGTIAGNDGDPSGRYQQQPGVAFICLLTIAFDTHGSPIASLRAKGRGLVVIERAYSTASR